MLLSRVVWSLVVVSLGVGTCVAQSNADERGHLVQHIGSPEGTTVSTATVPGIPEGDTLRVYLSFGMDMRVRDNFMGWIDKWNKKEGKKFARLDLVERSEDADLIFVRIVRRDRAERQLATDLRAVPTVEETTTSARASSASDVVTGEAHSTTKRSDVRADQYSYDEVPVFAYILRRTDSGPQILWRYVSSIPVNFVETEQSGKQLFEDFKTLIKKRPRLP